MKIIRLRLPKVEYSETEVGVTEVLVVSRIVTEFEIDDGKKGALILQHQSIQKNYIDGYAIRYELPTDFPKEWEAFRKYTYSSPSLFIALAKYDDQFRLLSGMRYRLY